MKAYQAFIPLQKGTFEVTHFDRSKTVLSGSQIQASGFTGGVSRYDELWENVPASLAPLPRAVVTYLYTKPDSRP